MLAEIGQAYGRPRDRLVGWLKQNPEALAKLPKTAEVGKRLLRLNLTVVPSETATLPDAIAVAQTCQLLLGDASIVVEMQQQGMVHLATNDDDFDRVPGITVWKPRP